MTNNWLIIIVDRIESGIRIMLAEHQLKPEQASTQARAMPNAIKVIVFIVIEIIEKLSKVEIMVSSGIFGSLSQTNPMVTLSRYLLLILISAMKRPIVTH